MSKQISEEQAVEYRKLEILAKVVSHAIDEFDLGVLQAGIPEQVKLKLFGLQSEYHRLAYMLHPKSQWCGGERWIETAPHIVETEGK
jgi:hypothetical protein